MIARPLARPLARPIARPLGLSGDYDPEALSYFARAGVTDGTAKSRLNGRIKGLKALGLWGALVEEYHFRPSMNKGTGTLVYGLKNRDNASLVNGPAWAADSVRVNTTSFPSSYVRLVQNVTFINGCYVFSVHMVDSVAFSNRGVDLTGAVDGGMWAPFSDGYIYWDCLNNATGRCYGPSGASNGVVNMWAGSSIGTRAWLDKVSKASGASYGSQEVARDATFGRASAISPSFVGNLYCVSIFDSAAFDQATHEANYNLYVATAGAGLDLEFDSDARAYFARASVTDYDAKKDISDWVSGLKSLGLWSAINECWSGLAAQNRGTGTTAYGLKGAYNATLTNGPTWGADGITVSGSASIDSATMPRPSANAHLFYVSKLFGTDAAYHFAWFPGPWDYSGFYNPLGTSLSLTMQESVGQGSTAQDLSTGSLDGFVHGGWDGSTAAYGANGTYATTAQTATPLSVTNNLRIDGGSQRRFQFGMVCNRRFTSVEAEAVRTLYKATIGKGLGLP